MLTPHRPQDKPQIGASATPDTRQQSQEDIQAQQGQEQAQGVLWRDCTPEIPAPDAPGVYLLALYLNGTHAPYRHARHYLGYAVNVRERIEAHRSGKGARFTQVVIAQGYDVLLVRVWEGAGRGQERQYKRWHKSALLCPICSALAHQEQTRQERHQGEQSQSEQTRQQQHYQEGVSQ